MGAVIVRFDPPLLVCQCTYECYHNRSTNETTFICPPELVGATTHPPWQVCRAIYQYYHYRITRETTWICPPELDVWRRFFFSM